MGNLIGGGGRIGSYSTFPDKMLSSYLQKPLSCELATILINTTSIVNMSKYLFGWASLKVLKISNISKYTPSASVYVYEGLCFSFVTSPWSKDCFLQPEQGGCLR